MDNGNALEIVFAFERGGDGVERGEGEGHVGLVLEIEDGSVAKGVAGGAGEEDDGAGGGGADVGHCCEGVEGLVGEGDVDARL